jgi:hypothetical protein
VPAPSAEQDGSQSQVEDAFQHSCQLARQQRLLTWVDHEAEPGEHPSAATGVEAHHGGDSGRPRYRSTGHHRSGIEVSAGGRGDERAEMRGGSSRVVLPASSVALVRVVPPAYQE